MLKKRKREWLTKQQQKATERHQEPEINGGLSGIGKRNERRQRCEVRGERSQLQTATKINMTQPALHWRNKVSWRWSKFTEKR